MSTILHKSDALLSVHVDIFLSLLRMYDTVSDFCIIAMRKQKVNFIKNTNWK